MNLHLLRVFAAVADKGTFSQAADALYISQPAVSKSVQELERQLDVVLFDRSGRKVTLTEGGSLLYSYAQQIFAIERAAESAIEQLQGLERGQLALGASNTIGTYLLPSILGAFHRCYPGVHLSLEIGNTQQIVEYLVQARLDMAFVEGPVQIPNLIVSTWRMDTLAVIAAPDHPLVGEQPLTLERLFSEAFIMREPGSGTRDVVEIALRERNIQIQTVMELGSNQAVKQAVSAGLGVAIVSDATITLELKAGALIRLDVLDFTLTRPLSQVSIHGRSPSRALIAFQHMLQEAPTP